LSLQEHLENQLPGLSHERAVSKFLSLFNSENGSVQTITKSEAGDKQSKLFQSQTIKGILVTLVG
jgi:hypothetical protein